MILPLETPRLRLRTWEDTEPFFHLSHDEGSLLFPITDWRQPSLEKALPWICEAKTSFRETGLDHAR